MTHTASHPVRLLFRLTRMGINVLVGAAALTGYFLKAGHWPTEALAVTLGCILLASGCSALNQAQEVAGDRLMRRTRSRPIAAGVLSARAGVGLSLLFFAAAAVLLARSGGPALLILAGLTVLLYNGIYTPLKRITPFTLLIGAVMGAFPPLFGWLAAGGSPLDREIVVLMIVFWFWQTPHFWLLVDRYRDDYRRAGYPQVFQTMPDTRYRLLILLWVWAYLVSILLIPLFLPVHPVTRGALAVLPVLLGLAAWRFRNRLFPLINASILLVMLILVIDRAIHP